jgi:hypothetical protein
MVLHGEVNAGGFLTKEPHYFDNGMPTAKEPGGGTPPMSPISSCGAQPKRALVVNFCLSFCSKSGPAIKRILHRFRVEADFIQREKAAGRDASRYTFGSADPDNLYGGRVIGSQVAARTVTRQEMIAESRPEARLIAIIRDPVSRAFSQYRYVR